MPPVLRAGSATDVGRVRHINEDQVLVAEHVYAVADGMGGHQAGEVASLKAVEALRASFGQGTVDDLVDAVQHANRSVYDHAVAHAETRGMGTTLTALAPVLLDGELQLAVVNVGDSRAYLLRDGELTRLTEDHSLVEELVREGQLTPAEALVHPQRSIITRALGIAPDVDVDVFPVAPYHHDRILLCCDGLTNELADDEIASILRQAPDPDEAAATLVGEANARGGSDNITVVVVDVVDWDDRSRAASAALAAEGPSGGTGAAATAAPPPPPPPPPPVEVPAPADDEEAGDERPASRRRRRGRRRKQHRRRRPTLRVVVYLVALLLVVGAALGAVTWYARQSWFVGFAGDRVAIFQGRPDGLLWFDPTLEERTALTRADVPAAFRLDVAEGKETSSRAAARRYVERLEDQIEQERRAAGATTTTSPATTTPPRATTTTGTIP